MVSREMLLNTLRLKLRILPVTARDIDDAIYFYHKYMNEGVPPRDTLHLAVMLKNNIKKILTVDKHFETVIREVERIDLRRVGLTGLTGWVDTTP